VPQLPEPLERLITELSRLPGVGPKTAQRLAFHLLRADRQRADSLAQAIADVKARIGYCERCYNISEGGLCMICASTRRDQSVLCVVETALDVLAVERTSEYSGLYFVLHGVISPIDGIGPDQMTAWPRSSWPRTPTSKARRPRPTSSGRWCRSG
jgi:recombination protein RecR